MAAERFENVTVLAKANVFFEGKVVSHTLLFSDARKKTLGLIYPGSFKFNTDAPEKMEIIAGSCRYRLSLESEWKKAGPGEYFNVAGKSSFEIAVDDITQYICSFE